MRVHDIAARLQSLLTHPPTPGLTSLPFGSVFCSTSHTLRSVVVLWSAAILVLSGKKTIWRGAERMQAEPGQMFLLPSQIDIAVQNELDPTTGHYLALCLPFTEDMVAAAAAGCDSNNSAGLHSLESLRVDCDEALTMSVGHMLDMARFNPQNTRLMKLCSEEILELIASRSSALPSLWQATTTWSSRCAFLISLEPGRSWSAADIAGKLGVSERSLRRNLQEESAKFRHILQSVRLNAGLGLLQNGAANVGEVAYRCGYSSASRFAVLFKERFGVSPSEVLQYNAVPRQSLAES
ncbi:helix-turn-helix transcriptional regulator [Oceanidesulfovibrio indonesiensis]|nr:helix-turn-helix transcriptional regulator [Oceanidesulfovibrio indonesiensis]